MTPNPATPTGTTPAGPLSTGPLSTDPTSANPVPAPTMPTGPISTDTITIDRIRRALGTWVLATLVAFVPINLVGFASPFAAHARGDLAGSRALLESAYWIAPLLSLAYLLPGWHLAAAQATRAARVLVLAAAALVPAAWWLDALAPRRVAAGDGTAPWMLAAAAADVWLGLALFGFVWLCWRGLRRATVTPGPTTGS